MKSICNALRVRRVSQGGRGEGGHVKKRQEYDVGADEFLQKSKQMVKSLLVAGQGWILRIANNPTGELKVSYAVKSSLLFPFIFLFGVLGGRRREAE